MLPKKPSLLRKSAKEDLVNFDFQHLCDEWKERAPLFFSFLMSSAVNKRTKECSWLSGIALAGSVLLKQRSEKMNATASVLGILLKSKSVEASYIKINALNEFMQGIKCHFYLKSFYKDFYL